MFIYQEIARSYDRRALTIVRSLSVVLDTQEVRSLTGQKSDYANTDYQITENRIAQVLAATNDAKAAYFFTLRDGSIYFMAATEPIDSDASPSAGILYENAPPEAYDIFTDDGPIFTKAYTDQWGSWVSAFIMLPPGEENQKIAFGLNFSSDSFYTHAKYKTLGVSFCLLLLFVLLIIAALTLRTTKLLEVEKKKAEEAKGLLQHLQQKDQQEKILVETTLQSLGEAVITTDLEGKVVIMNRMAENLTGWGLSEALGKPLKDIYRVLDGHTLKPLKTSWPYTVLKTGLPISYDNIEVKLVRKDGSLVVIEDMASPLIDEKGLVTGVVVIFVDGTEKQSQQDKVLYLSTHDGLTGLLNRQSFYAQLHDLDVQNNYPLVLMLLDVNGLKLINEAYGYSTGDSLLNEIAVILQRTWHRGQIIGRVDGDEFGIIFPKASDGLAQRVSREIQETLGEKSFLGYALTISIGYGKKEYAQTSIDELHKRAEDDLIRNKFVENQSARLKMVDLLLQSLFKKSTTEMEHSKRVGALAKRFGIYLGYSNEEVEALHTVGVMHDIGKIAIATRILHKQGKLNDNEWKEIQRHPEIGFNIFSSVNQYAPIAEQVLCHHERWDGKGYPNQISGEQIPLYSRILAICDSFDAMTNKRSYRLEVSNQKALDEISRCSNTQFDPTLASAFIEMMKV